MMKEQITLVCPSNGLIDHFLPLGLGFIGAYLQNNGHQVKALDMRFHSAEELVQAAKESEFVGFSVMTVDLGNALRYARLCKKSNPEVKIVFGGPHPTMFPVETLQYGQIDLVVIGEGEITMLDLVQNYPPSESVKGIAYRDGEEIKLTQPREYIPNLDELFFPNRDLFPVEQILKKTPYWPCLTPYPVLSMISYRGCPYNCIYCQPTLRKIFGRKVRKRSPERTVDEMEYLYKKYSLASVFMADDLFTADKDWVMNVCQEIRKRGLHKKLVWDCESRANTLDEEIARELKNSGCYMVWFGTESFCQKTLNTLRKGTKVEHNISSIKLCRQYKLLAFQQLMVGNPGESLEEVRQTEEWARAAKADITTVAVTSPVPGTDLYDHIKNSNLLLSSNLDDLGSRFKGREKFKLLYSHKQLNRIFQQLKHRGEINLRFLITRDYYRRIMLIRLSCHLKTGNYFAIVVDISRIIYGALPFWLVPFTSKLLDPVINLILNPSKSKKRRAKVEIVKKDG